MWELRRRDALLLTSHLYYAEKTKSSSATIVENGKSERAETRRFTKTRRRLRILPAVLLIQ